jgi:hypothetical protein
MLKTIALILALLCVTRHAADRQVTRHTAQALRVSAGFDRHSAAEQQRIAGALVRAARGAGLPLPWLLATCDVETRFTPGAISRGGAGIAQQLPRFSGYWSDRCWDDTEDRPVCSWADSRAHNLTAAQLAANVEHAARIAARQLAFLVERYGVEQAAPRYFGGPGGWQTERAQAYAAAWQARADFWARRVH